MPSITLEQVKQLREKSGFSIMACKKALEEAQADEKQALKILEKKGLEKAAKKAERETKQGIVEAYIHSNKKIGVLLELNCETDFVARNDSFKGLAHDLALHIASMNPKDKKELLGQSFIKDESKTINELIVENVAKLGENIKVGKFERIEI